MDVWQRRRLRGGGGELLPSWLWHPNLNTGGRSQGLNERLDGMLHLYLVGGELGNLRGDDVQVLWWWR